MRPSTHSNFRPSVSLMRSISEHGVNTAEDDDDVLSGVGSQTMGPRLSSAGLVAYDTTPASPSSSWKPPPDQPGTLGLTGMQSANPNGICSAVPGAVRKVTMGHLLQQRLRMPIFQRRYCWGEAHWRRLLDDALLLRSKPGTHFLDRITCATAEADGGRILVIDGQQRSTTCALLLAAIRDLAAGPAHEPDGGALAAELDAILFPASHELAKWLAEVESSVAQEGRICIAEGEVLGFAAVVPTFFDRATYFATTLPPRAAATTAGGTWQRTNEAKSFFVEQLQASSVANSLGDLRMLANIVMHRFEWLFFPVDTSQGSKDGTGNLQVIFERLALRETNVLKKFAMASREGYDMGAADFVRNLLLSSFLEEAVAISMYKTHWIPIDRAAQAALARRGSKGASSADLLERMLESFLEVNPESSLALNGRSPQLDLSPTDDLGVSGDHRDLYPRFRHWLAARLQKAVDEEASFGESHATNSVERGTEDVLRQLSSFAVDHFAQQGPEDGMVRGKLDGGARAGVGHLRTSAAAYQKEVKDVDADIESSSTAPTSYLCWCFG